jgi:hypothetical protein
MKAKVILALSIVLLASCAGRQSFDSEMVRLDRQGAIYERGDGRDEIVCAGGSVPRDCGSVDISGRQVYWDCSNEEFRCVYDGMNVLAVPTAGLAEGREYSIFGARLRVSRCFVDLASCEIAVVTSECEDAQICRCRSDLKHLRITFYYTRAMGVVSFFWSADLSDLGVTAEMQSDSVPLGTYVLITSEGFLKAPFVLPRVIPGRHCIGNQQG